MWTASRPPRNAMTLIELLIVIAIITLLLQIAIPAVEMSREAARRAACANNLRQVGVAVQSHESSLKHYPAGGWGFLYVGDADRGIGRRQPGGWIYNVLPYVDQMELHDLGKSLAGDAKLAATEMMISQPLPLFACPSRRLPRALPFHIEPFPYANYRPPQKVGKSDYAGNGGDLFAVGEGPPSYSDADKVGDTSHKYWINAAGVTGIFYQRSTTKTSEVVDGLSKTYLVGEKYIDSFRYTRDCVSPGDDQCMYVGADEDIIRWAADYDGRDLSPRLDKPLFQYEESFGSPHPNGCQFLFCDGAVRSIEYDIDTRIHRQHANRHDTRASR